MGNRRILLKTHPKHIVLLTISDLFYEANIHRKAHSLKEAGYQVTVVAAYHPQLNEKLWDGITLVRFKLPKGPTPLRFAIFVLKALWYVLRLKADLFIAYDYLPLLPLRLKAMVQPCRYIYDSVELLMGLNALEGKPLRKKFWLWYERFGLTACEAAFTVCASDAKSLQDRYPKLNVAGFVRNIPEYAPSSHPHPTFLREKFSIPKERKIGIYQGMIFKGRGLEELITACRTIEALHLVIVGDGPLLPHLKELVKKWDMEHRVTFTGLVPFQDLKPYTYSADVGFTLINGKGLSYYHALPNKLFEYIQAEVPIIGSNYPEIARIIEQEKIGLTVNPDDIAQITQAVQHLLLDENYRFYKANLKRVKNKYTWQKESEKYLEIVQRVLQ